LSLSHGLSQGTPFFMALEIMECRLLCDENISGQNLTLDHNPGVFESDNALSHPHGVMHNYLHDADSLCWVHLWTLLSRIPHSPSQTLRNNTLDNTGIASTSRRRLFLNGLTAEEVNQFHPTVRNLAKIVELPSKCFARRVPLPLGSPP
jgi:hypothetical protein